MPGRRRTGNRFYPCFKWTLSIIEEWTRKSEIKWEKYAKRYCQTFFGKPVLSIRDFSLIGKPFSKKTTYWQTFCVSDVGLVERKKQLEPFLSSLSFLPRLRSVAISGPVLKSLNKNEFNIGMQLFVSTFFILIKYLSLSIITYLRPPLSLYPFVWILSPLT